MRLSIAEIISKVVSLETDAEKIEFMRNNNSVTLRLIIKYTYDENIKFLVPDTRPPWKKNGLVNVEGRLYSETRRLPIFLVGGKYDGRLSKAKVETLFIELLEGIDDRDAEILANMIEKKEIVGLSREVVEAVYPDIYQV